jgi:DNA mismatch repair protein MutH
MRILITSQSLNRKDALRRISLLAGKDLRPMADQYRIPVWKNGHENKGWAGLVIERYLCRRTRDRRRTLVTGS